MELRNLPIPLLYDLEARLMDKKNLTTEEQEALLNITKVREQLEEELRNRRESLADIDQSSKTATKKRMSNKPLGRKAYGSIPHLSNSKLGESDRTIEPNQEKLLTEKTRDKHDKIIVTEKYDGANVAVAKVEGRIIALMRAGYTAASSDRYHLKLFDEWVEKRKDLFDEILEEGERLCGEWLMMAHGIEYKIEGDPIMFFDYFNANNERYSYEWLANLSTKLPIARYLHIGGAVSVNKLQKDLQLGDVRAYSNEGPEGMVYRLERKGKVSFLAKWVRSDFVAGKYMDHGIWNQIKNYDKEI